MFRKNRLMGGLCAAAILGLASGAFAADNAKNVILMVSDGLGFNGWEAARYYQGSLPYDNAGFKFYGMTTYMHNVYDNDLDRELLSNGEANGKDAATKNWTAMPQGYDPAQMWTDFNYHRGDDKGDYNSFTDSAAAATAMYTGQKTYNSAVSYSVDGQDIPTFFEQAARLGKATGSISSVQFNHATPACVDAHSYFRYNKDELGWEMVNSDLDVIMGGDAYVDAQYDPNTGELESTDYEDHGNGVGVPGWKADAEDRGFTVVDTDAEWADLESGALKPNKVAGLFTGSTLDGRTTPTLEQMTRGTLNVLEDKPDGFALMVEGGAVDWQNHDNDVDLMMREQVDFDNSVQAVMDWITDDTNNSSWDNTLLIVTSDHETGGIWGPETVTDFGTLGSGDEDGHLDDTIAGTWNKVVDNGEGVMPGVQYTSGGHTNVLVPLWVKGAGDELFEQFATGLDTQADAFWTEDQGWMWDGRYVDNTNIYDVMAEASNIPEPTTMVLLGAGGLLMLRRRRSA